MSTHDILHRLSETLLARRDANPETSYTAQLFAKGPDSILKKIGEECTELVMAGKDGKHLNIVWESTDVIYHVLVLLAFYGLGIEDVSQEMRRREGISGIDEKASRLSHDTESVVAKKP
jgi:phosphoribosyl-ATP pyrophosphohydrolase